MPSPRRFREWLLFIALMVFISVATFVPFLLWLFPNDPSVAVLAAVIAAFVALNRGYDLYDRLWSGKRRPVSRSDAPIPPQDYVQEVVKRLSVEEDQYVPLAGQQAPFEGYDADYAADHQTPLRAEYQNIAEALSAPDHRKFVIIGDPGAGKTTTLKMLAVAVARAQTHTDDERDPPSALCMVMTGACRCPCGLIWDAQRTQADAEKLLHTWWSEIEQLGDRVTDAMRNGRVWLFLDGLNEMPEASRDQRAKALRELLARGEFSAVRVVVTCRERDYAGDLRLDLPVVARAST